MARVGGRRAPRGPGALAALLRRARSPSARQLMGVIAGWEARAAFERIVREVFPEPAEGGAILGARQAGWSVEGARVTAFVERFSERYFPLVFCEEYEEIAGEVPWERRGIGWTEIEEFDGPTGYLLLILAILGDLTPALVAHCEGLQQDRGIGRETLGLIPRGQRTIEDLEAALGGGPYAATVDMARWLYGETGYCFLDITWEYQVLDNEGWTPAYLAALTEQWRGAGELVARVDALCETLEADPDRHFAALLRAVAERPGQYPGWHRDHGRSPRSATIGDAAFGEGADGDDEGWPPECEEPWEHAAGQSPTGGGDEDADDRPGQPGRAGHASAAA